MLRCFIQFQKAYFCFSLLKTYLPKTKNAIPITFSSDRQNAITFFCI